MKTNLMIAALAAALSTAGMAVPAVAHPGEDHAPVPQAAEGEGVVKAVDVRAGTVVIAHGPIAALNWPAMTMEFKVANSSLLSGLKPGMSLSFEFVERGQGEWIITAIKPVTASAANPHTGHN